MLRFITVSGSSIPLSIFLPNKTILPTISIISLIITFLSDVHPENISVPICIMFLGIEMVGSKVHPEKAPWPIFITLSGIIISTSEEHPWNT